MIGVSSTVLPGSPFDAFADGFAPGLAADITVSIFDADDNLIQGPTGGAVEIAPIGIYARYAISLNAPTDEGIYLVVWDDNQADPLSTSEELYVSSTSGGGTGSNSWIDGFDVADCCDVDIGSSDIDALDDAANAAVDILLLLTGNQFPGIQGPVTVRPHSTCGHVNAFWLQNWGQWNYGIGAGWWGQLRGCRCQGPPTVTLAGYPIREIVAVKIDGAFIPSSQWRLDHSMDLVRMRDPADPKKRRPWPARQILDLPDTEPNTWSITYRWGADVPASGIAAAKELACALYRICAGDGDCGLPSNVVKVVRAGLTQERTVLATAIRDGLIGLPACDLFIGSTNPDGVQRRAAFWSPDVQQFPYRPGS